MNRCSAHAVLSLAMVALSIAAPVVAQSAFRHSKVVFHSDLPAAHDEAMQQHEGDLFVYFYRSGDPLHAKMDSLVFSDERLSQYINENFGVLAVAVETERGRQIMEIFQPGSAQEPQPPYIAVASKRHANTVFFNGWHNVSLSLDEYGLDSNGQHWSELVAMKEFGQLPPKPGEEGWGRWTARVIELRREFAE